jgi:putative FmdB family regulatory protein
MPIHEFYCPDCNVILSFYARTLAAGRRTPGCPHCARKDLDRQVSVFAMTHHRPEGTDAAGDGTGDLGIDESKMEHAINALASEAEGIGDDDPRKAADLMKRFSNMTGIEFTGSMREALDRLGAGEDPEAIEEDLGDKMNEEEPFVVNGQNNRKGGRRPSPKRDQTLYDL